MDTLTYWNGTWHEGNPAILGPRDHAFWLGSMVFDGGRAFEGCGPDLDLHAERAVRSARALGLSPKQTPAEILTLMHESVRRFGPKAELYVRPMFWAGKGGAGPISVDPDSCQFLLCVYLSPMRAGSPLTLVVAELSRPDAVAADPRIDALRARMEVRENPGFTRDYADPEKRYIGNAVEVFFKDGTRSGKVSIDMPIGHRERRGEGIPVLLQKFESAARGQLPSRKVEQILALTGDTSRFEATPIHRFLDLFTL